MLDHTRCPFCVLPLALSSDDEAICANGHSFKPEGLSLATNMVAARALWVAVSAVEDDAAGLAWRAQRPETSSETKLALLAEAAQTRAAAASLRVLATAAQRRLDDLPYPTTVVHIVDDSPT